MLSPRLAPRSATNPATHPAHSGDSLLLHPLCNLFPSVIGERRISAVLVVVKGGVGRARAGTLFDPKETWYYVCVEQQSIDLVAKA